MYTDHQYGSADQPSLAQRGQSLVGLLERPPRMDASKRGTTNDEFTLNVDLAPTILHFAGFEPPKVMQGRDISELYLKEIVTDWRTEFYYEHVTLPAMIPPCEGVRTERWKYIRWTASNPPLEELYDLASDPFEEINLAGAPAHAAKLEDLRATTTRHAAALP